MTVRSRPLGLALILLCVASAGCNLIEAALGRNAKLSNMVPGGNIGRGGLECWLTFEFERLPKGIDLRDVRVRFTSVALEEPVDFDWAYIANHDFLAASQGARFGSGNQQATATTGNGDPPLGEAIKVRFPLPAKEKLVDAPRPLTLEAELFWGGKKQDSLESTIEHVYESRPGSFL